MKNPNSYSNSRFIWNAYWNNTIVPKYINYTPELLQVIQEHLDVKQCIALEIGAGTGGNSIALAALGAEVVALDFSEPATRRMKLNASENKTVIQVINGSAHNIPFTPSTFDLVFHQGFLEHFDDPIVLIKEQARVLRPDGWILVDVPQRYNLYTIYKKWRIQKQMWDSGGWETEFSHSELCRLLRHCGFEPVASYGRGIFPYLISGRNQLKLLEHLFFQSCGLPPFIWRFYDGAWHKFQHSAIGINTLMCVGVLARKL